MPYLQGLVELVDMSTYPLPLRQRSTNRGGAVMRLRNGIYG